MTDQQKKQGVEFAGLENEGLENETQFPQTILV